MRYVFRIVAFLVIVFVLPALVTLGWWVLQERPGSWRVADWSSSGLLPVDPGVEEAAVYVLAARTGGLKGALSVHSWIVVKKPGQTGYERHDKVGWGSPLRRAARLIPKVEAAIESYPWSRPGDYQIWPGPNSNSFVAHVLREVPELGAAPPPNAAGRDFAAGLFSLDVAPDWRDVHATLGGLVGFAAGLRSGFEIHFMGLVAGIDFARPALKIPAYGRVDLLAGG